MTSSIALPGEETLIGSWTALAQLSPGVRLINLSAATAAVFRFLGGLNNAILQSGLTIAQPRKLSHS